MKFSRSIIVMFFSVVFAVVSMSSASGHDVAGKPVVTYGEYQRVVYKMQQYKVSSIFDARGRVVETAPLGVAIACPKSPTYFFCDANTPGVEVLAGPWKMVRYKNSCGKPVNVSYIKSSGKWLVVRKDTYFPQYRHCSHGAP